MAIDEVLEENPYIYQERDTPRNLAIRRAHKRRLGERGLLIHLGDEFGGIKPARIHQIVFGRKNRVHKRRRPSKKTE